jgi:hypothetical protein
MRTAIFGMIFVFSAMQVTFANEILINITGGKERKSYDGKPICELQYDITNKSTGTIHYLSVSVDGWDDRGDKLDEILGASLGNSAGFGKKPIAVDNTVNFKQSSGFKTQCKYMGKIKVTGIKPEYCNIRMLPEDANCEKLVKVMSSVDSIKVE